MRRIATVLSLILMLSFCGKKQTKTEASDAKTTEPEFAGLVVKDAVINQILQPYLSLKDAFVNGAVDSVRNLSLELQSEMDSTLNQAEQTTLKTHLTDILTKMAGDSDINAQRVEFESLSKIVYAVVKNSASTFGIYKQFCPMAFDNKGAFWLSLEEKVTNPYFGDEMLNCGVVQEEL